MAKVRDLFQAALEELGVYEPGEPINAADIDRCLQTANELLDSWSNESLTCFAILEESFPLVVSQAQYTIGETGTPDISAVRPLKIIQAYMQDFNGNNYPLDIYERDRWNDLGLRTVTAQIPSVIFYDPQFPLGIINIFPVPLINYTVFFDSYRQLTEFPDVETALSFPPGYQRALRTNLGMEIADFYGVTPTPNLARKASISLGNIKRTNIREVIAKYDSEIVSRPNSTYNIYTDSNARPTSNG